MVLGGVLAFGFFPALPLCAHESRNECPAVLVGTDMGIDDLMAVALALQCPDLAIRGVVAGEGACERGTAVRNAGRLLGMFNRSDVPLYEFPDTPPQGDAPEFRSFAEQSVSGLLDDGNPVPGRPWQARENHASPPEKLVVLLLGPFSDFAQLLKTDPQFAGRIDRIVASGSPIPAKNWNLARDPTAFEAVAEHGIPITFVDGEGLRARKPAGWVARKPEAGRITSQAARLLADLLASEKPGRHYIEQFPDFTDELAFLYLAEPALFQTSVQGNRKVAKPVVDVASRLTAHLRKGRQHRKRVVFGEIEWPPQMFQPDVRQHMEQIIRKNGETEWLAQVLMSEMHEHLGAYSILGAKMGLRAAELLNAPQHGMHVISHTHRCPPAGCLNDGLIVATGSTPGRGLFEFSADPLPGIQVTFEYNERRIRLSLRPEFQKRIRDFIAATRKSHSLEDPEYWRAIRSFGLEIWENWHRNDLFEVRNPPGRIQGGSKQRGPGL